MDRLIRTVAPLISDPSLRVELGRYGREFAMQRFGLTAMSERLATFYREASSAYSPLRWALDFPGEAVLLQKGVARSVGRTSAGRLLAGGWRGAALTSQEEV